MTSQSTMIYLAEETEMSIIHIGFVTAYFIYRKQIFIQMNVLNSVTCRFKKFTCSRKKNYKIQYSIVQKTVEARRICSQNERCRKLSGLYPASPH